MEITKIFGPPGTGKTTKLLTIMEQELGSGVRPEGLAYLTFTVAARREALSRAMLKFQLEEEALPNFKTLHALCYRELGMTSGSIIRGGQDLHELADMLGIRFTFKTKHRDEDMLDFPWGGEAGDRLLQFDHGMRHGMMSFETAWSKWSDDADLNVWLARRFVNEYKAWKEREGRRDFTDLLEAKIDPLDIEVVIVDEAQDLSPLQWDALHRLTVNARRMYLAGDDDQSIFTWAGASPSAFVEHPGTPVVLEQSYRIPGSVHRIADQVVRRIRHRYSKGWNPREEAGQVTWHAVTEQADILRAGSYLILYRHHYQANDIEEIIRTHGIPYLRNDKPAPGAEWGHGILYWEDARKGKELSWWEMKHIVDAIAVDHGMSRDGIQLFLAQNRKERFFFNQMVALFGLEHGLILKPWFDALTKIPPSDRQFLRAIIKKNGRRALTEVPSMRLSTIHAAKGQEADHVLLHTDMSVRTRDNYDRDSDDECRVFYVGVTRARQTLAIIGENNPIFR